MSDRATFTPIPSADLARRATVTVVTAAPAAVEVGLRDVIPADAGAVRSAAADHARARATDAHLVIALPAGLPSADAAAAVVEGALLARYRYDVLRSAPTATPLTALTIVAPPDVQAAAERGAAHGSALAAATALARDLANTPHNHLSATRLARDRRRAGPGRGPHRGGRRQGGRAGAAPRRPARGQPGQRRATGDDQADLPARRAQGSPPGRPRTSRSWARGSCTTRAASPSSPATRSTPR